MRFLSSGQGDESSTLVNAPVTASFAEYVLALPDFSLSIKMPVFSSITYLTNCDGCFLIHF